MSRDELYREELEQRQFELEREGVGYREAKRISREEIKHDHDDGGE